VENVDLYIDNVPLPASSDSDQFFYKSENPLTSRSSINGANDSTPYPLVSSEWIMAVTIKILLASGTTSRVTEYFLPRLAAHKWCRNIEIVQRNVTNRIDLYSFDVSPMH